MQHIQSQGQLLRRRNPRAVLSAYQQRRPVVNHENSIAIAAQNDAKDKWLRIRRRGCHTFRQKGARIRYGLILEWLHPLLASSVRMWLAH